MSDRSGGDESDPGLSQSPFDMRLAQYSAVIRELFFSLYDRHPDKDAAFRAMLDTLRDAHAMRPDALRTRDEAKLDAGHWYLSHEISGMSLYVDRFCGNLQNLSAKLDYFTELGVNFLHLMPIFMSPEGESDGGYAVSDFRKVDERFGSLEDLRQLQSDMLGRDMYLMLDIVFNHTSHQHEWASKARAGDPKYQAYFYMFDDRGQPDVYDASMPDIFPESAPGNFTYVPECNKWVMTVFHQYQWDLNYRNPGVFTEMLDTVLFYANLGVDILRIDAPAFIWKEPGTSCQNLPEAHQLLQLLRICVAAAAPGMALLGEAIVSPADIMKYFGTGSFTAMECDLAYNATHMSVQWDALATGDTGVMLAAQPELLKKPFGTTWINYVRCHDDIGLGYDDHMIRQAGYDPYAHRSFVKDYYSGIFPGSPARGALFSVNPKTQDARISGSLASLCGLEWALEQGREDLVTQSVNKIILMQAQVFFLGGIPMMFYGDELGYMNDYSYQDEPSKHYDNRWMHRPRIDWEKNERRHILDTIEYRIFSAMQKLIRIRARLDILSDLSNISWMHPHNRHVAGFVRMRDDRRIHCVFNFSGNAAYLTWFAFKQYGHLPVTFHDHWREQEIRPGYDHDHLIIAPYSFYLLEGIS